MLNAKREKTDIDYEKLRALNKRKEDLLVEYDVAEGEVIGQQPPLKRSGGLRETVSPVD